MSYRNLVIIGLVFVTAIGGIVSGAVGALVAFATVGLIAVTGHVIQLSVDEADKHRQ